MKIRGDNDAFFYDKTLNLKHLTGDELAGEMLKKLESYGDSNIAFNNNEILSWKKSLPLLIKLIINAGLGELDLILEYETPLNARIDAILTGYHLETNKPTAIIIELKQWDSIDLDFDESVTEVRLKNVSEKTNIRSHPIVQTHTYKKHLIYNHSNLGNNQVDLIEIQYLHNYINKNELFSNQYSIYESRKNHCFVRGEEDELIEFLKSTFKNCISRGVTKQVIEGQYSMEKLGYENLVNVLNDDGLSPLLDEQRDISAKISKIFKDNERKHLIMISGDCGTGKTYLGLYLLKQFIDISGSKNAVFTATSRIINAIISGHTEIKAPYVNRLYGIFDLVIIDEAHRIHDLDEVLDRLYKVNEVRFVIVLQDDRQRVRIKEEGLKKNFKNYVEKSKNQIELHQEYLSVQKRSMYQSSYVDRINDLFSIIPQKKTYKQIDRYEIQMLNTLNEIDLILDKYIDSEEKAQWFAPFCWEWTKDVRNHDVIIPEENFYKPWNPINEQFRWYSEIKKCHKDRIGCIYTAQGLDFDYVGYIFWNDLVWSNQSNEWIVDLNQSHDKQFIREIVETYGGQLKNRAPQEDYWTVYRDGEIYRLNRFIYEFGNPNEVKEIHIGY
ncbi:hypothetical protein RV11_GL002228 [Enterococcus phoeniculicola]|uniref:Schlafen group 3-like DNA/RNA helicase domain-containing protein n=2 Tax=Enterococcus phoeniculicola TaxID=154621 RepID=R3TRP2_9ENTE|nr:DNA/RNA helicase domain-containing protein [Enterococcus phoeniculicola]EOL43823.1 hypothetical protein UC3_01804 [Enterococcus phoeniculicola ATCC BAA-412]EOT76813.1 hypothetical protein I589_01771 [Enterococcus phoeniculicola ATCC BAA-412]OJG69702.1 hypothetical protein RV11_GL002228 [Enterococcus phoeniculicola]